MGERLTRRGVEELDGALAVVDHEDFRHAVGAQVSPADRVQGAVLDLDLDHEGRILHRRVEAAVVLLGVVGTSMDVIEAVDPNRFRSSMRARVVSSCAGAERMSTQA